MLRHFQFEIEYQCKFALITYNEIKRPHQGSDRTFYALQAFLVACGNISKIMWPQLPKKDEKRKQDLMKRGEMVRQSLSVNEDSPLANRDLRNHFEHYDERIESWYRDNKGQKFIDGFIGSRERIQRMLDVNNAKLLRHFDPETEVAVFLDETYDLKPVVSEVKNIYERVSKLE